MVPCGATNKSHIQQGHTKPKEELHWRVPGFTPPAMRSHNILSGNGAVMCGDDKLPVWEC